MDHNEICMFMDVKLDIHGTFAQRYKKWIRCQVKIEAVKCVPCFLRLSFQTATDNTKEEQQSQKPLSVSVNVPGVSISLATSRTKQHSYGLFWTQNRRDCFIYFALETETACRQHMKWMKKSIKNLELYRQVFLEERRLSRGPSVFGPLPILPETFEASLFTSRISRVSEIYEEIFDGSRISRASIASGIYEEMKPSTFFEIPPALPPPLPAHRKRINTFEGPQQKVLGEIPRSSTTPESDLAKKKKYKNMLDNLFGTTRQKRSGSVSEKKTNEKPTVTAAPLLNNSSTKLVKSQRNSFSSPDLSKLNFLDTFGEAYFADLPQMNSDDSCGDLNVSLDESAIEPVARQILIAKISSHLNKADSLESLNVSEQLPHNFNFSACNSSTINLIGANGAVPHSTLLHKNKILVDDLTGYCVMAPIVKKISAQLEKQPTTSTASTSSGYSTGSYCSSTSSCNTEEQQSKTLVQSLPAALPAQNESNIYEPMHGCTLNTSDAPNSGFAEHLYENLLAVKAAQELEQPLGFGLSTSTPTESPLLPILPQKGTPKQITQPLDAQGEDYYQTPRRSIISVDEKIPSYYPNSCDTLKSKRRSPCTENSTGLRQLVNAKLQRERKENLYISSPQQIIEHRQKQSPTPSSSSLSYANKTKTQTKKTAAHKISEGVYAVTHAAKRSPINNNNETDNLNGQVQQKLEEELLQLAMLQNIDFKFDDSKMPDKSQPVKRTVHTQLAAPSIVHPKLEEEYEHCYQAAERATRLLQKYATLAKFGPSPSKSPLKQHQCVNIKATDTANIAMTQSVATPGELQPSGMRKFASLPRFKKIDFSPLKMRLNNVLQRNQQQALATSTQPPH